MNSTVHPVAPEEIMALLDGELTAEERKAVTEHLGQCAECAAIREEFLATSQAMAQWTAAEPSPALDRVVEAAIAERTPGRGHGKPRASVAMSFRNWQFWAVGAGGAVAGALLLIASVIVYVERPAARARQKAEVEAPIIAPESMNRNLDSLTGKSGAGDVPLAAMDINGQMQIQSGVVGGTVPPPSPAAPMIARTVSLTIRVRDIAASRVALDGILAQVHGYAASLTLNTPEGGPRSFQSSLRIPAPELQAGLDALRKLGRVQTETQSGEEVTQQHADLAARLTNARETEQRLRQMLAERTGKMEDVLAVEEKISETRGDIERMEAEQTVLEHRVAFVSIDLQLLEEYKERFATPAAISTGTQMRNAIVAGLRNAGGSVLGLILFLEEFGPVILVWLVILGGPAVLVWRRYRRMSRRI